MKFRQYFLFFLLLMLSSDFIFAGCGEDANPAIKVMCELIIFIQGRVGRVIVAASVMRSAWQFMNGGIKWDGVVTLFIGIGFMYAPKTFALFLLPDYIEGMQGNGYLIDQKVTPDEIISCACPDLK